MDPFLSISTPPDSYFQELLVIFVDPDEVFGASSFEQDIKKHMMIPMGTFFIKEEFYITKLAFSNLNGWRGLAGLKTLHYYYGLLFAKAQFVILRTKSQL